MIDQQTASDEQVLIEADIITAGFSAWAHARRAPQQTATCRLSPTSSPHRCLPVTLREDIPF
jgi:hypothetical protein